MGGVSPIPQRGDVWETDFDPVRGHEQGGRRPALIISAEELNSGPSPLVFALPITTRDRDVPAHVRITPPDGGITTPSVILCDQLRAMTQDSLLRRRGSIERETLREVEARLRLILDL